MVNLFCIIVTFNGAKWIRRCLDSLSEEAQGVPSRIVVLDNGSTDDTIPIIKEEYPEVTVIKEYKNSGFGKANNVGIYYAYNHGATHFLLLNQDASMAPGAVGKLLDAQTRWNLPLVSPVHMNGSGQSLDLVFCDFVSGSANIELQSDLFKGDLKDYYRCRFISAACWFLPKDTIEMVGGFDPLYFHYGEDEDYCERLIYHGGYPCIVPSATMYHDRVWKGNPQMYEKNRLLVNMLRLYGVRPATFLQRLVFHLHQFASALFSVLTLRFSVLYGILRAYVEFFKRVPFLRLHRVRNRRIGPNWLP